MGVVIGTELVVLAARMAKPSQPQQPGVSEVRATPPEKQSKHPIPQGSQHSDCGRIRHFRGCDPVGIVHRVGKFRGCRA